MNIEHKRADRISTLTFGDLRFGNGGIFIVGNELEYLLVEPNDTSVLFNDMKDDLPTKRVFKNKDKEIIKSRGSLDKLKFNMKKLLTNHPLFAERLGFVQWHEWAKTIGGAQPDYAYDIDIDNNGDIVIVGYQASYSHGSYDIIVMKLNTWGEIIWQKVIGGADDDRVEALAIDSTNNIYLTGYQKTEGQGNFDYFIVKLNNDGDLQWQKAIGGTSVDAAHDITIDNNDIIYVVGQQASSTHGSFDISVVKLDTTGVIDWQRTIGDSLENDGYGITNDTDGNIYITGKSIGETGNTNLVIIKMTATATIVWQKTIVTTDTTGFMEGYGITFNSDHIFVTGFQNSATHGLRDYFLIKMDLEGNQIWSKVYGGSKEDYSYSVKLDNDGNIYLAGKEYSNSYGGTESEYGVIKLDSSGDIIWQRAMGNLSIESARSIVPDNIGNVYVVGYQKSYTFGLFDIGLIKLKDEQPSNMALNTLGVTFTMVDSTFDIGDPTNMVETSTSLKCIPAQLHITDWKINNT